MKERKTSRTKTLKKASKSKDKSASSKSVSSKKKPAKNDRKKPVYKKKSLIKNRKSGLVSKSLTKKSKLEVSKHGSSRPTEAMKSKVKRDYYGRVLPGSGSNGGGRPKGTFRPSISDFSKNEVRRKIREFEAKQIVENSKKRKKHKKSLRYENWLEHLIKKSYDDTTLAVALLKMQFPTLKAVEAKIDHHSEIDNERIDEIRRKMQRRFGTTDERTLK